MDFGEAKSINGILERARYQRDNLLEQIERYLRTQNNEDLCNDSADLIDFIETVRDDELIRRMEQADDK